MAKQCIFFDMDGTLIDSMKCWREIKYNMCDSYFERTGEKIVLDEEETKQLEFLSLNGAIKYVNKRHGSNMSFREDVCRLLGNFYQTECQIKPYVMQALETFKKNRIKMAVITATPASLAREALKKQGILDYFKFILTPENVKGGKYHKPIFYVACLKLRKLPKNAVLIDDGAYAHKTARAAGLRTVGVYDKYRNDDFAGVTDVHFNDFKEILDYYNENKHL